MKWEDLNPEVSLQADVSLGEINKAIPTQPWWTTYFEKKPLNIRLFLFHRVQSTNNTHLVLLLVLYSDCRGVCTLYVVWALTKRSFFDSEIWKYRPRICLHKVSLCLCLFSRSLFLSLIGLVGVPIQACRHQSQSALGCCMTRVRPLLLSQSSAQSFR